MTRISIVEENETKREQHLIHNTKLHVIAGGAFGKGVSGAYNVKTHSSWKKPSLPLNLLATYLRALSDGSRACAVL